MTLETATREKISTLIGSDRVVLFMKGNREAPQCGFSATVVGILDRFVPEYTTVDVLSDPEVRDGIKAFSSWPTIPQLYVGGEFVGGCDIVQEMFGNGELGEVLGAESTPPAEPPAITVTEGAAAAFRKVQESQPGELHLSIDARYQSKLFLGPTTPDEIRVESGGITLFLDAASARRAGGVTIDGKETPEGPAFQLDNPNAPRIVQLTPKELKAMIDAGEGFEFFDVRTPEERETARIEGTRLLDQESASELEKLDRDTPLVFHCHHGGRSQGAAEHFSGLGFKTVYNLAGGIDAWSQEIDPSIPRY